LRSKPREQFEQLYDQADIPSILGQLSQFKKKENDKSRKKKINDAFKSGEAILSGIMAAAKAIKLQDAYGEKSCDRQWNEVKK